jgi:hypothetical protein
VRARQSGEELRGAARGSRRSVWRPRQARVQEKMPTGVALHRCQARGCAQPRARVRHAPGHDAGNQRTHAWEARAAVRGAVAYSESGVRRNQKE